ncbi:hypothetical protein OG920_25135 [Streptomyces europaeiscabiei]|nr:hypothetical protein [Streptomyces europaeiscabiei]MDX3618535.1 hypothetical protein [Streptomyces europaeiscabiei]MDX3631726.1 hypothetical protein [Streptomyces europaeiscabiei]MDX3649507.1 hypothetical protein [Streptomyces europaeiscabiei]WUD34422.1 hypothetical protein OG858_25465 [Streptomyces europaeiscabiei]
MTMTNAIHRPPWVPVSGHRLRVIGVHFDAVRIEGGRGETVAGKLIEMTGGDAGPVVLEQAGFRWMYFLLRPGTVHGHAWLPGVQRFGLAARDMRTVTYVGIPALDGNTFPLRWYSEPTSETPYVEAELLLTAVRTVQADREEADRE